MHNPDTSTHQQALDVARIRISEILSGALSGMEPRYRTENGYIRWRRVEKDLHAVVREAFEKLESNHA